jgi:hypothetical protein
MKFYQAENTQVGEGVEATVIFHEDNGTELLCVRSGFEAFEEANPDVEEISVDEADEILAEKAVVISVPARKEVRSENHMSKEDIAAEIDSKDSLTVDIATAEEVDPEGNKIQKLTFFEKREIKSVEDFLKAQADQLKEPEQTEAAEIVEAEPVEEAAPVEEEIK